jgi:toxin YoeB
MVMKQIIFEESAFQNFVEWASKDNKLHQRIIGLIKDILREPYSGIGKPEPLKHGLSGYWSRRINDEHRLVYQVDEKASTIISCKYHYK